MKTAPFSRVVSTALALVSLVGMPAWASSLRGAASVSDRLAALESASGGRLGVAAVNTADDVWYTYRGGERFPFCSTFKVLLAGAVLRDAVSDAGTLARRIPYTKRDLVPYSPIRIRAGVPTDWQVADKTGTGDYGTTNDLAVLWPPGKSPIVLVVYFTQHDPHATPRNRVIAKAARLVAATLAGAMPARR